MGENRRNHPRGKGKHRVTISTKHNSVGGGSTPKEPAPEKADNLDKQRGGIEREKRGSTGSGTKKKGPIIPQGSSKEGW